MEKTIKASVISLTKIKRRLLDNDYNNYQWWMIFGVNNGLLSYMKQHKRFKQREINYREYFMPLRSRFFKDWFRTRDTKLTKNWIKIPNSKRKGRGLWLPIKLHQEFPKNFKLKDSYLVKKRDKYYIYFCIDVPEAEEYNPKGILSIDLGLKNPVTMVNLASRKTYFLGKQLKQIRCKYYYLRKKLGKEKNLNQIIKVKDKERRKVHSLLHNLSKSIVLEAYKSKSALIVGHLKGLPKNKGRRFNRRLGSFSYYKLTQFIEYKAKEKGVPFLKVDEAYTSKTCSVCDTIGKRTKNWFSCSCGYEDNADRNAAFNIGKRGLSYMLRSGVEASAQKSLVRIDKAYKEVNPYEETSTLLLQT